MLSLNFLNKYSDIGSVKKSCTKIMLKIVPLTEYLYVPKNAKVVDIKILNIDIVPNSSFLKHLV